MPQSSNIVDRLFSVQSEQDFNEIAVELFYNQFQNNPVYRSFAKQIVKNERTVRQFSQIPFLPIGFFKSHDIMNGEFDAKLVFKSSGTTGTETSRHLIKDPDIYQKSFLKGFERIFGEPSQYVILALLPSYLERKDSSLVYMADFLIKKSQNPISGFYLNNYNDLQQKLRSIKTSEKRKKVILLGVSFALLDMARDFPVHFPELIIIETGGMKGRREEMIREELHEKIKEGFGVGQVYSEYGMTELLSQAYSTGEGLYSSPPWMKVLIRDANDPLTLLSPGRSGGINIIDLANIDSCPFVATQDLGKVRKDGKFEVLGRFDNSDIRGCNLMVV